VSLVLDHKRAITDRVRVGCAHAVVSDACLTKAPRIYLQQVPFVGCGMGLCASCSACVWGVVMGLVENAPAFVRSARTFKRVALWQNAPGIVVNLVLAVTLATAVAAPQAAQARGTETGLTFVSVQDTVVVERAEITVGKSRVIELDQTIGSALIAEPKVADVVPLNDRSVYVVGKRIGTTRLVLTDTNKAVVSIVEILVIHDTADLQRKLKATLNAGDVTVTSANGGIVLGGTVPHVSDVNRALAIAENYAPDKVTNALSVTSPQQVMLEVRFVEATKTASRSLGIGGRVRSNRLNLDVGGQAFTPAITPGSLATSALLSGAEPFGTMIARVLDSGTKVDTLIRALEEKSLVRRLAEPNLVALSGSKASFLAGGEFPIPVGADDNTVTIEFKQFGVALDFVPVVLANGQINLKISPEVSEIDSTTTVSVSGVQVPGLSVRKASTMVELYDGQSFAIAGLLQNQNLKGTEQIPWLGSVPVLGALFRSAEFRRRETDLVIIVTPRLVKAKRPGEQLVTPLDRATPTNDPEFFILGRAEITKAAKRRGYEAAYGHILSIASGDAHVPVK